MVQDIQRIGEQQRKLNEHSEVVATPVVRDVFLRSLRAKTQLIKGL